MQEPGRAFHSFCSANTPLGYVLHPEQLYNAREGWKAYILKGGLGGGNTYLMQKTGEKLQSLGADAEYLHGACDVHSLEAVLFPSLRACIIDGTPPHRVEPKYPGAVETVISLGECWDENRLAADCEKIILFSSRVAACQERAWRFLAAAGSLMNDTYRLVLECTDTAKIDRYALRIAKREMPPRRRQGRESLRFFSAVTCDGVVCQKDLLEKAGRLYALEDEFGVGRLLLERLRQHALSAGYDIVSCHCPMAPGEKLEHLFLPSLSLGFVTSNHHHPLEQKGFRHIHIRRFLDGAAMLSRRQRIAFNRRSARELIDESAKLLGEARANYDMLDEIYSAAADHDALDVRAADLAEKLAARIENKP